MTAPAGFAPIETSPFVAHLGGLHHAPGAADPTFGMRVTPELGNVGGRAHGGFLATLADVAASRAVRWATDAGVSTVSLHVDYLEPVPMGAWVSAVVSVDRIGGRTAFTTVRMAVDGTAAATASVIIALLRPRG